nr:AraC family transcriptional regulator [uncultured Dyadobacter sp.]
MELSYYPTIFEKATYYVKEANGGRKPLFDDLECYNEVFAGASLSVKRAELLRGNLTVVVSEIRTMQNALCLIRMPLPVDDLYVMDFVLTENTYNRTINGQPFVSRKTFNHFSLCSSTAESVHRIEALSRSMHIEVCISRSYLNHFLKEVTIKDELGLFSMINLERRVSLIMSLKIDQEKLLNELLAIFGNFYSLSKIIATSLVYQLLENIVSQSQINLNASFDMIRQVDARKMSEVTQLMESNLERKYKLDEVSKLSNMSLTKFKKLFKKVNGRSFGEYYNKIRMEEAVKLLNDTRVESFTDVSSNLGFKNLSQFTTSFKKYYRCSPREYIRRNGMADGNGGDGYVH